MTDDRSPASALKGRLADVYVPALVLSQLEALSRRLGNRATIDDPLYGRASSLASLEPLLARVAGYFGEGKATYEHVCSTTGVDCDAAEGRLAMTIGGQPRHLPIVVIAERRRLREIELRVYYTPEGVPDHKERTALVNTGPQAVLAQPVDSIIEGLTKGAIEQVLAGFEEASRVVDHEGHSHSKHDGGMARFFESFLEVDIGVGGSADDGRTACIETTITRRARAPRPAVFAFQRGDSGLIREVRFYWG